MKKNFIYQIPIKGGIVKFTITVIEEFVTGMILTFKKKEETLNYEAGEYDIIDLGANLPDMETMKGKNVEDLKKEFIEWYRANTNDLTATIDLDNYLVNKG